MTDKPLLFSGPMVRAILAGRKTITRREIDTKGYSLYLGVVKRPTGDRWWFGDAPAVDRFASMEVRARFSVGDWLWVRETWKPYSIYEAIKPTHIPPSRVFYAADEKYAPGGPWRPSIFMPRWASRITLRVTSVKVERLQSISAEDCEAEGIESELWDQAIGYRNYRNDPGEWFCTWPGAFKYDAYIDDDKIQRRSFQSLWESINGEQAWARNPYVFALGFEVYPVNIDLFGKEAAPCSV